MKKFLQALICLLFILFFSIENSQAASTTQTIILKPGWNAVYLEVQPQPNEVESVFKNLKYLSIVWSWNTSLSSVEYIQDPNKLMPEQSGWLVYIPANQQQPFLKTLHAVNAGKSYLIKIDGNEPVTWTVTGNLKFPKVNWKPNSFNLVGFPINPTSPPTFTSFFAHSSSHAGQEIYRLNDNGAWELVRNPASTFMRSGEAFWVYCSGSSSYSGPMHVQLEQGEELNYGSTLSEQTIHFENNSSKDISFTISNHNGPISASGVTSNDIVLINSPSNPVNLFYWDEGISIPEKGWKDLTGPLSLKVSPGKEINLRLAVKRPANSLGVTYESTLQITNDTGSRILLPVKAIGRDQKGLWVGHALINAVSAFTSVNPSIKPEPTSSEFLFKLMFHFGSDGKTRLLKEVIQMWKEGTYKPDTKNPSVNILDKPGRYVLITDDSLVDQYSGSVLRGSKQVGQRLSSSAFDFEGQFLEMNGSFGNTLTGSIEITGDFPTNPFKHRYHPDHDNLDENGRPKQEAYSISRQISLVFTDNDPTGENSIYWGDTEVGGIYKETISGLHRHDIVAQGFFRLHRVSETQVLNQ